MNTFLAMTQILSVNETLEELKDVTTESAPDPLNLKVMELLSNYRSLLCTCMERTELLASSNTEKE